jgi:hypothetical protein
MHCCLRMLLTTALLAVAASISVAQEPYHAPDPNLIARLSYENSPAVQRGTVRHVCVAVSRDGEYRIVRSLDNGQAKRLHGKMSKEDLRQLTKLLGAADFRNLSGDGGGLIRQEAEIFMAEILEPEAWHLQWLNADGENPFPASVFKLIDWLQRFQPKDGKSFEYTEYPDVCPAGGLRLLQPSVAENSHN